MTRRGDVTFHADGRIDITAHVSRQLKLERGDVVGIATTDDEQIQIGNASWALVAGSEFIDAGTVAAGFEVETDLAGNARIVGNAIDLGAYEYQNHQPSVPGDVTGDGKVDISDVNTVINIMLGK